MTLNRPELGKAIEPDSCFYIQNAQIGQGIETSISSKDTPPDLAIEVDIANRSDGKFMIYQAIAVPEIWVYQREGTNNPAGGAIKIKQLENSGYIDVAKSRAFPALTTEQLTQWIEMRRTGTDLTVIRAVRAFCRHQSQLAE